LYASVRASVLDQRLYVLRYFQYLSMDFRQISVIGASWDRDELIRFWGPKVKVTLLQFRFLVGTVSV